MSAFVGSSVRVRRVVNRFERRVRIRACACACAVDVRLSREQKTREILCTPAELRPSDGFAACAVMSRVIRRVLGPDIGRT